MDHAASSTAVGDFGDGLEYEEAARSRVEVTHGSDRARLLLFEALVACRGQFAGPVAETFPDHWHLALIGGVGHRTYSFRGFALPNDSLVDVLAESYSSDHVPLVGRQ